MDTSVLNLSTGTRYSYSLPAREAVAAAYAQYDRNDWNTWDYATKYVPLVQVGPSGRTVSLGDFSAMLEAQPTCELCNEPGRNRGEIVLCDSCDASVAYEPVDPTCACGNDMRLTAEITGGECYRCYDKRVPHLAVAYSE